jgi:tetratricopeptide (TPR) repeat protein
MKFKKEVVLYPPALHSALRRSLTVSLRLCLVLATIGYLDGLAMAQAPDANGGREIYKQNADSVFLLLAKSASGEFVAQGSGFLIKGQKIITNAHVANAGRIYLVLGAAKIPTKLESVDTYHDIAVLTTDVELTSLALSLAAQKANPGDTIYAIGNPQGLEKTISQGLVSGLREIDGRELVQLTAPISHGSSGGPVFNSNGEVMGIAVGSMADGQNLNFAVPVGSLRRLLENGTSTFETNALATLEETYRVQQAQKQDTYSSEDNSPWQVHQRQINKLLKQAVDEAGNDPKILTRVAQVSLSENTEISIEAAQRGINIKASPELEMILAKAFTTNWIFTSNKDEKAKFLLAAEHAARAAISSSKAPTGEMYYTLADVLADTESYVEAQKNYKLALSANINPRDEDLQTNILRGLITSANGLSKPTESEQWFQMLSSTGKASPWDWQAEGDRLYGQAKFSEAEHAYQKSAETGGYYREWCYTALTASFVNDDDTVLSAARNCINGGTGEKDSEKAIAMAHTEIAQTLNKRGVYSEALAHAREALTLSPDDASSYDEMADSLFGLRRFEEVVTAAQQAIRLSDGKFAWMHFRLGSAYFELQNWDFAKQSFEKAAELNPKLSAAVYNVAVCYLRQGYYRDAAKWYEEYLRRNPNASDRSDVEATIRRLKNS